MCRLAGPLTASPQKLQGRPQGSIMAARIRSGAADADEMPNASWDYSLPLSDLFGGACRGSTGYGEDGIQSLPGNIGTNDVADCVTALDAAIAEGNPVFLVTLPQHSL